MRVTANGVPLSYFGGDGPGDFPIMLGRDIFNNVSDTGLNRSPIDDLVSYTLGGLRVAGDPPIDVEQMTYALVVDGSAVIVGPQTGAAYLMPDIYCPDENTIVQYIRDKDGCLTLVAPHDDMSRLRSEPDMAVWTLGDGGWSETIYTYRNNEVESRRGATLPADALRAIPNGRGILFWPQNVWHRMEELSALWREVISSAGLKPWLFANNIGDEDTLSGAIARARSVIGIPDSGGRLERLASTAPSDSMAAEYARLREDWFAALNTIEQDSPNRPVAEDRVLRMKSTTQFVRRVREKLEAIYGAFSVTLKFDRLIVQTAEERLKEAELIQLVQPSDMRERLEALIP